MKVEVSSKKGKGEQVNLDGQPSREDAQKTLATDQVIAEANTE